MKTFTYTRPESLDEALTVVNANSRPLAGGTDLLTLMKGDIFSPEQVVDIKRLPELSCDIRMTGDVITIGSLATLTRLEDDPLVRKHLPALAQAASLAATPQLRNMATIGGNVLQRPRCWYFRDDEVPCWLKGGDTCYARGGQNQHHGIFDISPCVAAHPSDLATVLVAYGATIQYRDGAGEQEIGAEEFFRAPTDDRRTENVLPENAVITGMTLPVSSTRRGCYQKAMDRKVWAFAQAAVAVVLEMDGDAVSKARIVLGGVAPVPIRATAAEQILDGAVLNEDVLSRAADAALADAQPLEHNGYKVPLSKALLRDALRQATG